MSQDAEATQELAAAVSDAPAPEPRPPPNVKPGAMIGEKYRVERELGRGGFGVVVCAMHLQLDQRVAIKVLTEGEGSTDAEFAEDAERFRREAKATAALRSPHVVRVLDVDVLDSGYPYIVMEYLEGKTFYEMLYAKAPLPLDEALDYILQVLAALADAHSVGVVHRDLKPANIFLSKGPGGGTIAKVLDFGVSKVLGGASQLLTQTGAMVGTVAYMAPEQLLDAKRVDGRADLWSVGILLYEALTRTHPFGSTTAGPAIVTSILKETFRPAISVRPDLPPGLDAVLSQLLEKAPERRFASAVDAAVALAPFAPPRARAVLDEIRRAPPPGGVAAVAANVSGRHSAAPPPPVTGDVPPVAKPKRGRSVFPVVFIAAILLLGGMAAFIGYYKAAPSLNAPKR